MPNIRTDMQLRTLLRTARKAARLSQDAAAKRAGVSRAWWRRLESAAEVTVTEDTLTEMMEAVGVQPEHLRALGHQALAENLARRLEFDKVTVNNSATLEQYLMHAPASEEVKLALVITARTMREIQRGDEPFADRFPGPARTRRGTPEGGPFPENKEDGL